jgi:alkanesulfonate monooxygenase
MPVEFIGMIATREHSEIHPPRGPVVDVDFTRAFARGGRLALHVISGGSDTDQRRDGDYLDHDARYRRTDEYLDVVRRVWTADAPIDHEGEFYRFEGAYSEVRCVREPHLPIYFGGSSDAALRVSGRHADVYAR